MFCALLLTELGVDEETVRKDYLFTNEAVDFDRITPAIRRRLKEQTGREVGEREMRAFLGVEAAYLDAAMEEIGDPREYLRGELGLEDDELERVKRALLT